MSFQNQIRRDLALADVWAAMDVVERALYSAEHGDEFGYFWHRVSALAQKFATVGAAEPPLSNSELSHRLATIITYARGDGNGHLQGLPGGRRDDQPAGTVSRTPMRHASPGGRRRPTRSYA